VKRLVICCDGTWNSPENTTVAPSNVLRLARTVRPTASDGAHQIVYYDPGVGSGNLIDKLTGGAFGSGLSLNVREAYAFIVMNYEPGDSLYFFGFSRGAYTVRSTAGFVRKVGILQKRHAERIAEGWRIYRIREGDADTEAAQDFRNAYSHPSPADIDMRCIGVWDTVGALGIPGPLGFLTKKGNGFHDVALSSRVKFAFHAVAVDEKRRFFRPTLWEQSPKARGQVLEQAWFPGVHADIGGGYPEKALADNTLAWMLSRARLAGLEVDQTVVDETSSPDAHGALHESRSGPYRLIPALHRPIGRAVPPREALYDPPGETRQRLDEATERRFTQDGSYRPPELVRYLHETATARPGPERERLAESPASPADDAATRQS
jgi:uncharacterized protein (DUF2235 family)